MKKEQSTQLKISSFFFAGKNELPNKTGDNKQTKLSKYFSSGKNNAPVQNKKSNENGIIKNDIFLNNKLEKNEIKCKVIDDIDLTKDDVVFDKFKEMLSPLKDSYINQCEKLLSNGLVNDSDSDLYSNNKLCEKENSPVKNCITEKLVNIGNTNHNVSPDVILPTPPRKTADKKKNKGIKRKFDFSNIDNNLLENENSLKKSFNFHSSKSVDSEKITENKMDLKIKANSNGNVLINNMNDMYECKFNNKSEEFNMCQDITVKNKVNRLENSQTSLKSSGFEMNHQANDYSITDGKDKDILQNFSVDAIESCDLLGINFVDWNHADNSALPLNRLVCIFKIILTFYI